MRVLIISDTHGDDSAIVEVRRREPRIDVLLHAGDSLGSESFYQNYLRCITYFVAGNCDGFCGLPSYESFVLGRHRVFMAHGHRYAVYGRDVSHELLRAAQEEGADILVFGHTHVPLVEKRDGILCINPGSLSRPRQKGHRPSYALLSIDDRTHEAACAIRYL